MKRPTIFKIMENKIIEISTILNNSMFESRTVFPAGDIIIVPYLHVFCFILIIS
jgi:hypothetical protein